MHGQLSPLQNVVIVSVFLKLVLLLFHVLQRIHVRDTLDHSAVPGQKNEQCEMIVAPCLGRAFICNKPRLMKRELKSKQPLLSASLPTFFQTQMQIQTGQ